MNITSTRQANRSPATRRTEFPSVKSIERKILMGDALVGAVQGFVEGSTAIFTSSGDYARAPMSVGVALGITAKSARKNTQRKLAASALRSAAYGAAGAIFGPTAGYVALGVGAAVGATLAVLDSKAELAQRRF